MANLHCHGTIDDMSYNTQRARRYAVIQRAVAAWPADPDFGLRIDEAPWEVGEELPPSRVWEDGEPTNAYLPGTSAIDSCAHNAAQLLNGYFGDWLLLVTGTVCGYGEDEEEVIIRTAVVEDYVYLGED
jgi:hypothetical protein